MHLWPLWIVFLIIIGVIIHYFCVPSKYTGDTYDISTTILTTFGADLERAKEEAMSEEDYLRSIRQTMMESKRLSKVKVCIISDVETPELTAIHPQVQLPDNAAEVSQSPTPILETEDYPVSNETLSDITHEEEITTLLIKEPVLDQVDDALAILDVNRIKMAKVVKTSQGKRILEIVGVYEESIPDDVQLAILSAIYEYTLEPNASSIGGQDTSEDEDNEYRNIFDVLRNVKLYDHVVHVVEEISKELAASPGFEDSLAGDFFLMALYHDVAKLSHIRNSDGLSAYRRLNHPVISAQLLKENLPTVKEEVFLAVQMHHDKHFFDAGSAYFKALKAADHRAREFEAKAQVGEVPTLIDRLSKTDLISLLLDIAKYEASKVSVSAVPNAWYVKGHLLIRKELFFDAIKAQISRTVGLCREMLESNDSKFQSAALKMLAEYKLVPEIVLTKKIQLTTSAFGKTRSQSLDRYIAIPITTLGLLESEVEVSASAKSITSLEFV